MIKISGLSKEFKSLNRRKVILDKISLELSTGRIVVIIGESGSGKSTLLDILSLNDLDYIGTYYFNGSLVSVENLQRLKKSIVFLNQGQTLFYELNTKDNTLLINSRISKDIFKNFIRRFGLTISIKKKTKFLSGGEKQRVGVVRTLSRNSKVLILDEPTSNLDNLNKTHFIDELRKYRNNRLIIIATHDKDLVDIADDVYRIKDTRITKVKSNGLKKSNQSLETMSNNNYLLLIFKDILSNKKRTLLFISALSNGLIGLLLGFVIVSGFENFFVDLLINEVPSKQSIVYPNNYISNQYYKTKPVLVSNENILISTELFNFYDQKSDLINNVNVVEGLKDNEIILELDEKYYQEFLKFNKSTLTLRHEGNEINLLVRNFYISNSNQIKVSKDYTNFILDGLKLNNKFETIDVLNYNDISQLANIARSNRLIMLRDHFLVKDKTDYLNYFDINSFDGALVCNKDYKIYCDANSSNAYIDLIINGKANLVKVNNDKNVSISSKLFELLDNSLVTIKYDNLDVITNNKIEVYISDAIEANIPFKIFTDYNLFKYGHGVQAEYLLIEKNKSITLPSNQFRIVNPFDEYYKSFKEILDFVMLGFLIYSFVSLLLGFITVMLLILLELDSKRKHVGTLLLIGWSKHEIRLWIVASSIIKAFATIIITMIFLTFSVNSLNNIIKDVSDIEIKFYLPDVQILIVLVISLVLIVGNIALFHTNSLLKISPKKLISGK